VKDPEEEERQERLRRLEQERINKLEEKAVRRFVIIMRVNCL